jgi:hypothetical protein
VLSISDDLGPLFLMELQPVLTEEERGGIAVAVDPTAGCTSSDGYARHHEVAFTWDGGSTTLMSTQKSTVLLPGRTLEWVLGQSVAFDIAPERGIESWWLAWPQTRP